MLGELSEPRCLNVCETYSVFSKVSAVISGERAGSFMRTLRRQTVLNRVQLGLLPIVGHKDKGTV